jgi:hypothetical protein
MCVVRARFLILLFFSLGTQGWVSQTPAYAVGRFKIHSKCAGDVDVGPIGEDGSTSSEVDSALPVNLDAEAAKLQLESLFKLNIGNETELNSILSEDDSGVAVRISGTKRRRIEREKMLLGMLAGDQAEHAIQLLWKHWFSERGEAARQAMEEVENLMGGSGLAPKALELAASKLQDLIDDYDGWAEPLNRLAMVRFLQMRWSDSANLCEEVIKIKPWHFGALSGLIMCHQRCGDVEAARNCVAHNIPPPGPQRTKWVKKMVQEIEIRQKFIL